MLAPLLANLSERAQVRDFSIQRRHLAMLGEGLKFHEARFAPDTSKPGTFVKAYDHSEPHHVVRSAENFLETYGENFNPYRPIVLSAGVLGRVVKKGEKLDPLTNPNVPAVVAFQVGPAELVPLSKADPCLQDDVPCVRVTSDGEEHPVELWAIPLKVVLVLNATRKQLYEWLQEVVWETVRRRVPSAVPRGGTDTFVCRARR